MIKSESVRLYHKGHSLKLDDLLEMRLLLVDKIEEIIGTLQIKSNDD